MTIGLICDQKLSDFAAERHLHIQVHESASLKDIIESAGIPHVEIGNIEKAGKKTEMNIPVEDSQLYHLYSANWKTRSLAGNLQPKWPDEFRFVLDVHLGRLAREMRLLGIDAKYENDYTDDDIVAITYHEQRFVLTRDVGLLKHGSVDYGHWMRHTNPDKQVNEVLDSFDLDRQIRPFTRCLVCNGVLVPVEKEEIIGELPPRVKENMNHFYRCSGCGKVYWKGTHYRSMIRHLNDDFNLGLRIE